MGTIHLGPFKNVGGGEGCGALTGEFEATIIIQAAGLGQRLDCDVIGTSTLVNAEDARQGIINFPEACQANGGSPVSYDLAGCNEESTSGFQTVLWPAGSINRPQCWIAFQFISVSGLVIGINCIPQAGFDTTGPGSEGVDKDTYWEDLGITEEHTLIYNT